MAEKTEIPGFAGLRPGAVDHKSPPTPRKPEKSDPAKKPVGFKGEPVGTIDVHNPPGAKPTPAAQADVAKPKAT